jgi:hypothetical protein
MENVGFNLLQKMPAVIVAPIPQHYIASAFIKFVKATSFNHLL